MIVEHYLRTEKNMVHVLEQSSPPPSMMKDAIAEADWSCGKALVKDEEGGKATV